MCFLWNSKVLSPKFKKLEWFTQWDLYPTNLLALTHLLGEFNFRTFVVPPLLCWTVLPGFMSSDCSSSATEQPTKRARCAHELMGCEFFNNGPGIFWPQPLLIYIYIYIFWGLTIQCIYVAFRVNGINRSNLLATWHVMTRYDTLRHVMTRYIWHAMTRYDTHTQVFDKDTTCIDMIWHYIGESFTHMKTSPFNMMKSSWKPVFVTS